MLAKYGHNVFTLIFLRTAIIFSIVLAKRIILDQTKLCLRKRTQYGLKLSKSACIRLKSITIFRKKNTFFNQPLIK